MTNDYVPPLTDPALYPRVPDFPPPTGEDAIGGEAATHAPETAPAGRARPTRSGAIAGIVAAGALAVGIGVAVTSQGSASAQGNGQPGGFGGPGGQLGGPPGQQGTSGGTGAQAGPGGFGSRGGGQMVMGTVTAVGSGSITVKTTSATTTYTVSSTTQVIVNGAVGTLSAIKAGDTVLVQVPTAGASTTATRIIVGAFTGQGGAPGLSGPGRTGTGTST